MAIRLPVISEYSPKGIQKLGADLKQIEGRAAKTGFIMKKAFVPAAAALTGMAVAGLKFAKAAAQDQQAAGKLAQTLGTVTNATDEQIAATEEWITATSMSVAVADDELRPALATLARVTGDVSGAQDALSIALDVSAATSQDLQAVSKTLAKAMSGNTTALKKLDPQLGNLIEKGASSEEVLKVLEDRFGGAAQAAADSAEGGFKKLEIGIGEAQEAIGSALLPVIEAVVPKLQSLAEWAQKNPETFKTIALVIGSIAAAIVAVNIGMKAFQALAALQLAINTALGTSFSLLWVATGVGVIIAVVAALAVLQAKFDIFGKVVDGIKAGFGFLKDAAKVAFDGIKAYLETLLNFWKTIFNGIADIWNNTIGKLSFKVPSWIPGIGGKGFDVPDIPKLADGGIVTRPTLAIVGEAGPEAVVPLDRSNALGGVNITIQGALDPVAVGRQIRQILANDLSRYGRA